MCLGAASIESLPQAIVSLGIDTPGFSPCSSSSGPLLVMGVLQGFISPRTRYLPETFTPSGHGLHNVVHVSATGSTQI